MKTTMASATIALSLLLGGCAGSKSDDTPFPGHPIAVATNDCGPAGGAAISLVLRPEPRALDAAGAQVRVTIWREFGQVAGHRFASDDPEPVGAVFVCDANSDCVERSTWKVAFDPAGPDSVLTGELEIAAGDRATSRGRFRASWHPRTLGCI
jgi:hypothetical protein